MAKHIVIYPIARFDTADHNNRLWIPTPHSPMSLEKLGLCIPTPGKYERIDLGETVVIVTCSWSLALQPRNVPDRSSPWQRFDRPKKVALIRPVTLIACESPPPHNFEFMHSYLRWINLGGKIATTGNYPLCGTVWTKVV